MGVFGPLHRCGVGSVLTKPDAGGTSAILPPSSAGFSEYTDAQVGRIVDYRHTIYPSVDAAYQAALDAPPVDGSTGEAGRSDE